jgi:hypothetical protein
MMLVGGAVALLFAGIFANSASGQSRPPDTNPDTAYEGTVGDWAIGRWNGLGVRNAPGVGLISLPIVMVVQRLPNGKVVCRYSPPEYAEVAPWAPKCAIAADTITVTTLQNTSVNLSRTKAGGLEGVMRAAVGSSNIRFSR